MISMHDYHKTQQLIMIKKCFVKCGIPKVIQKQATIQQFKRNWPFLSISEPI